MDILIFSAEKEFLSIVNDIINKNLKYYLINVVEVYGQAEKIIEICYEKNWDVIFLDINSIGSLSAEVVSSWKGVGVPKTVVFRLDCNNGLDSLYHEMFKSMGVLNSHNLKCFDLNDFLEGISRVPYIPVANKNYQLSAKEILAAFEKGYFYNYYQPQLNSKASRLDSVEVLVRYIHPDTGLLSPSSFLSIRFDYDKLFWFTLEQALVDLSLMSNGLGISININQRTLKKPIVNKVVNLCKLYGFEPTRLTLELTEDEALDYDEVGLANLIQLREYGIGLAMDDFGTGHSTLSQLIMLPFTEIKIDKKFITNISSDFKSQKILETALFLAKSLDMKLIAEGVECIESALYLKENDVNYLQGFFVSKPVPLSDLKEMLVEDNKRA